MHKFDVSYIIASPLIKVIDNMFWYILFGFVYSVLEVNPLKNDNYLSEYKYYLIVLWPVHAYKQCKKFLEDTGYLDKIKKFLSGL